MREDTEWSPFEHKIAAALQSARPQPTNACPNPDDLMMLAEQGQDAPYYGQRMAHVAACAFCRPEYVQMRADLLEVERMRADVSVAPAPMLQAGQTQAAPAPATLQKAEGEQPQATVATQRASASQRMSLWQRLLAPRVLAPAFAASTLLASLSLKAVYSVQQENRTLARELTQERNQNSNPSQKQHNGEYVAQSGTWSHNGDVPVPADYDGDRKTDPQGPPIPATPDPSTVAKAQADRQLAEARKRLQADQARNAQTAERLKQAQARLERTEKLLNAQLLAASRKQNKAAVVTSNGPHSSPPDTHQGQTPLNAGGTDMTVSLENLIAMAEPPPEKHDLLTPEAGSRRSPGEELQSIELLSPQGSVILEPRPLLRWRPLDGAAYYKVYGVEVSRSPAGGLDYKTLAGMQADVRVTGTQYRIEHALAPGKVYSWEVTAYRDAEAKPFALVRAKFLVADAAQANAIMRLAKLQFAAAQSLEARQEWEQAESQYRAISSNVPNVYDQAQARIAVLEKRPKRRP